MKFAATACERGLKNKRWMNKEKMFGEGKRFTARGRKYKETRNLATTNKQTKSHGLF